MSKLLNPEEMTSRDYYFDSYAHFGIHERLGVSPWSYTHTPGSGDRETEEGPAAASCQQRNAEG